MKFTQKKLKSLPAGKLTEIADLLTPNFKGSFTLSSEHLSKRGIYQCIGNIKKGFPKVIVEMRVREPHDPRPQYMFRIIGEGYVRSIISEDEVDAILEIIEK